MPNAYALHPWLWSDSEQAHVPPPGAGAVLDLRPEAEQAKASQSSGWGLFAWPDQVYDESGALVANMQAVPLDAISLGYGDCRELQPTTQQRDELKTRLGLSAQPSGATLIDTISDCLGALADPSGQNGPKPLLPTREGLEIHLAYHSRVWSQAFNGAELFATTAKGRANRIRDVLRSDLETANKSGGPDLVAKVLGLWCDRWGVSYTQAAKWRNLIRGPLLAELLGKSGGKFSPRKPATSYSDDFNRADGAIGASWATSTASGVSWNVASNVAQCFYDYPTASTASANYARYESDLSSSDHWCDFTATSRTGGGAASHLSACLCRYSSSANTAYGSRKSYSASSVLNELVKIVSGTISSLGSVSYVGVGQRRVQASGTSISCEGPIGTSRVSVTDTSITGNTRCGLLGQYTSSFSTDVSQQMDDWSCDDGVSAGGQPMALRTAGMRLGWARVGRGF